VRHDPFSKSTLPIGIQSLSALHSSRRTGSPLPLVRVHAHDLSLRWQDLHVLLADRPWPTRRNANPMLLTRLGLLLVLSRGHRLDHSRRGCHPAGSAFGPAGPFPCDRFRRRSPRRELLHTSHLASLYRFSGQRPPIGSRTNLSAAARSNSDRHTRANRDAYRVGKICTGGLPFTGTGYG